MVLPAKTSKSSRTNVRVGILLTHAKSEMEKDELLSCKDREWAKSAPEEFILARQRKWQQNKSGKYGIPTDVAIGTYIRETFKNKHVEVDFIKPEEISKARLAANDLNFLLIYDLLEAFHTDTSADRHIYNNVKSVLKTATNIYPPRQYQEFVYSKINYYKYLNENKVSVLPTFTMTADEYKKLGHDAAMAKLWAWDFWSSPDIFWVIAKPVYGQEGKDIKSFHPTHKGRMSQYVKTCMKKYPGLVFQQKVEGFGNTPASPELRMYYMGNKYKYSISAGQAGWDRTRIVLPKQEGGSLDAPLEKLKHATQKILAKLPPIVMPNGTHLPRLITRLDMGYMIDGKYEPFVNEVEFVPSLYCEDASADSINEYIAACSAQMVKITKLYAQKKKTKTTIRMRVSKNKCPKTSGVKKQGSTRRVKKHQVSKNKVARAVRNLYRIAGA